MIVLKRPHLRPFLFHHMTIGIIGQGLAGTALAWQAHWAGHEVRLFDRGLHQSASWVAAGLINPLVLKRKRLVQGAADHLACMQDFYALVEKTLGLELFYPGSIHEVLPDITAEKTWDELALSPYFDDFIGPAKPLHHSQLVGHKQAEVRGSARLRVTRYLTESRAFFSQHHHLEALNVESIEVLKNGQFELNTSCTVDALLLAEGYPGKWTQAFFGPLPFAATRGEGLRIAWEGAPIVDALHKNVFLLPDGDGSYQAGSTYAWDALEGPVTAKAREEILQKLRTWFDQPVEVLDQWKGIRPTMQDRQARWAWHPQHHRMGFLNGLGSRGALTSPLLSQKLLADLMP